MQLGISVEPQQPSNDGAFILRTALHAERVGFDAVLMSSHLLENRLGSALDPLIVLATVAGATTRLGVATSVLVAPYYQPVILANQAASLDRLSNGRFILAVGTGWNEAEFAAVGVPLRERGRRTDEALAIMQALWRGAPVDFQGPFTTLHGARLGVTPLTAGGPPLWVGGESDAALRRALRFAAGWHGSGVDPQGAVALRSRLATLGEEVGRDPATLALSTVCFLTPPGLTPLVMPPGHLLGGAQPTAESVVEELGLLGDAGITFCSLWMPIATAQMSAALDWVATEIMPKLAREASAGA